jgi:hypothetical protein
MFYLIILDYMGINSVLGLELRAWIWIFLEKAGASKNV